MGYFDTKENLNTFSYTMQEKADVGKTPDNLENILELKNISQIYKDKNGNENVIFDNFNFKIEDVPDAGQFVVIVGASGCGKSTILRYFSGLQKPTSGEVFINGKIQTEKDRIGTVFQQYSSFPWLTVLQNVALSLEIKGIPKKERNQRAMEMIKLVGLEGHENKYAQYPNLSGGQLQRVALARNLVSGENIMLLDEMTSGLDTKTKLEMDDLLCKIWVDLGKVSDPTFLAVTHDLQEAVYLADRVYVMDSNHGRIAEDIKIDLPFERNSLLKREKNFREYVYFLEDTIIKLKNK